MRRGDGRLWERVRRPPEGPWCGVAVEGLRDADVDWLRAAMRDVGYPVAGWSRFSFGRGSSFTLRGFYPAISGTIRELWDNERPGYPINVRREYGG
jgi:hypothetical protein